MEKRKRQGRQGADGWRGSELAGRPAGSGSACFSAYPPGAENPSLMSEGTKSARGHSGKTRRATVTPFSGDGGGRGCGGSLHLRPSAASRGAPSGLPRHTSGCCVRSPRTLPALCFANDAILRVEAPPKLPFCSDQKRSQLQRAPAGPTCHRGSKPKADPLRGRHATRAQSKLRHLSRDRCNCIQSD